jgi:multicomponent Na+:H+ antiporter subunit F
MNMELVANIALAALALAAALFLVRLVRGPSLVDRIIALDAILLALVSGIAVQAARSRDATYLDVLVVTSLLGFVGTITVARYVERRGA